MKQKVVVFGTGNYYQKYKEELQSYEIVAFVDNDCRKHGTSLDGVKIRPVEECARLMFDYIILLSVYEDEMKEQLLRLNICPAKIMTMNGFTGQKVRREYKVYTGGSGKVEFNVLVVSNSLSLTGAPIVLLNAARVLKEMGYMPAFLSNADGKLREYVLELGIPVIVEKHLETFSHKLQIWMEQCEFAVVNTFLYRQALLNCDLAGKKVVWWLHEGPDYYFGKKVSHGEAESLKSVRVFGAGPVACRAFEKAFGILPRILLYGLYGPYGGTGDGKRKKKGIHGNRITFAIIGSVIRRKGTDLFVEAVKKLEPAVREKAGFLIVGECVETDMDFFRKVADAQKEIPQIIMLGEVDYRDMEEVYEQTDVLVCPSRTDPMPVVAAEAMARGKVCMVSERTGTAQYITDGVDGIIFHAEKADELAEAMERIICNPAVCGEIGKKARKVYEKYFSMDVFRKNFMGIVENLAEPGRQAKIMGDKVERKALSTVDFDSAEADMGDKNEI